MTSPAPAELPRIEGYELLRSLARGGMGEVFLAKPHGSDQTVAVKLLTTDSDVRFERETELVRHLAHPGLVRVLAHGVSAGRRYFVMEYVSGSNLRALLKPGQPLPLARARLILADIAEALIYLEQQQIVHRDLKPENVLLDEQGRVCLTDFGLCVRIEEAGQLTHTDQTVGTFDYMAPEQRSRLPVDGRADQYSLGVLAFEMLTGRRPQGRFKPPSRLNPRLPRAVDAILFRALQEDADDRYPDTAAFAAALLPALAPASARWQLVGLAVGLLLVGGLVVARPHFRARPVEPEPLAVSPVPAPVEPPPTPAPPVDEVKQLVDEAKEHANAHRRTEAIARYSAAIERAPRDPQLLVERAHCQLLVNDPKKALSDLDAALRLDPRHAAALVGRGALHVQERRYEDALADLNAALQIDPHHALGHAQRGRLRYLRNEVALALVDLTRAIELDANCGLAYHYRGLTRQKLGAPAEAVPDLRQSVKLTPNNPFAHAALSTALLRTGTTEPTTTTEALTHARLACELSGWKDASNLRQLAAAQAAVGATAEAARTCERALKLPCSARERKLIEDALRRYRPQGGTP